MSDDRYADLLRFARKRHRAEEEYREELERLIAAGGSYAEIARVLGISRQGVRQYAIREGRKP